MLQPYPLLVKILSIRRGTVSFLRNHFILLFGLYSIVFEWT